MPEITVFYDTIRDYFRFYFISLCSISLLKSHRIYHSLHDLSGAKVIMQPREMPGIDEESPLLRGDESRRDSHQGKKVC